MATNRDDEGTGIVLKGLDGVIIEYALRLVFKVTNNVAKFEASSKV